MLVHSHTLDADACDGARVYTQTSANATRLLIRGHVLPGAIYSTRKCNGWARLVRRRASNILFLVFPPLLVLFFFMCNVCVCIKIHARRFSLSFSLCPFLFLSALGRSPFASLASVFRHLSLTLIVPIHSAISPFPFSLGHCVLLHQP